MAVDVRTPVGQRHVELLERVWGESPGIAGFLTTVDHKRIGKRYALTAAAFFLAGGVEALVLRTQLTSPERRAVGPEAYDQLFTMHGFTMIFLFVTPMLTGAFGNYLVPLMLGARDMAFPRMNALSYWIYLASGIFVYTGLALGDAPDAGWFNYTPLSDERFSPGPNIGFYNLGLIFLTISSTVGATNFIVTILRLRAPGMSLNRMPVFCWAILATSFSLIFALPSLTAANVLLQLQRNLGFHFFDAENGGDPVLWQHLFWIFGHPDVYIIVLPALGIVSSIVPIFARRPLVAHRWVVLSTVLTAVIGFGVWVHHMFAVGLPQVTTLFFAAASLIIVVPSGIQIFAWCTTLVRGRPVLRTPLLYVLGFLVVFVIGGLTGIMFATIPFDQQVHDSYFVVAHFHYVLFGGAVFPLFAGLFHWFPKVTGRCYSEAAGKASFWLVLVGFNLTFFPMHLLGLFGMPRRVYTYPEGLGWGPYNLVETVGSFVLAAGIVLIALNLVRSRFAGAPAGPDPWHGDTLEWATTSPPPHFNFPTIPIVRSETPNWQPAERAEDRERLERGEFVLDEGHETPATTVLDGDMAEVLVMPGESPWPFVLAASLGVVFTMLLLEHYVIAGLAGLAVLVALAGWHQREPAAG